MRTSPPFSTISNPSRLTTAFAVHIPHTIDTQPFCQAVLQAKLDFFCHQVLCSGLFIPPKDLYHGKPTPGAVLYLEPGLTCKFFRTLSLFHSVCTVIEIFTNTIM